MSRLRRKTLDSYKDNSMLSLKERKELTRAVFPRSSFNSSLRIFSTQTTVKIHAPLSTVCIAGMFKNINFYSIYPFCGLLAIVLTDGKGTVPILSQQPRPRGSSVANAD